MALLENLQSEGGTLLLDYPTTLPLLYYSTTLLLQVIGEVALLENLQSEGGSLRAPARATIVAEAGAR